MRPADTQPEPAVQHIPLDRLELSPGNVRKTDAGVQAFAELKASVAALGILSNLVVRPVDGSNDTFAVVAGGRRYRALADLAAENQIPTDFPVPCRIVPAEASEAEISLAENVVRAAMHPADQVEAFVTLSRAGSTVAQIAARFGVAERTVEQRLRLGTAAPELLQAYREEAIDLECLKAFASTADTARQLAAWQQVSEQGYRPSAWQIRRMLTEGRVPAQAATATFVGIDAYEAAGGVVDRDLFADQQENGVWFENAQLLDRLATERLQAIADSVASEWKWTEARLDVGWQDLSRFGRVHAVPAEPTPDETAERDRLANRHDELVNLDDDEWTDETVAEAEQLERRLDEIGAAIEARATFSDEDRAIAGCIVTLSAEGETQLVPGLVKPDDIPQKAAGSGTSTPNRANDAASPGSSGSAAGSTVTMPDRPADPEVEARKRAGIGIGLADDLRAIRTAGIKARLSADFNAAFDLFVFQAAISIFDQGYFSHPLEIALRETADRPNNRVVDDSFASESPFEQDLRDWSGLALDWMEHEDRARAFAAFTELSLEDKQALFAAAIARTVKGQLAFEHDADPAVETTAARLDIDFAARCRPSADMFWSRIAKRQILDIARDTFGVEWAAGHAKDKKDVLAAAMERAFAAGDDVPPGITPDTRAKALAWTPPGFAPFDAPPDPSRHDPAPDAANHAPADPVTDSVDRPQPDPDNAPADTAKPDDAIQPRFGVASPPEPAPDAEREPTEQPAVPVAVPANGHDIGGDGLDIPAFLQRT